MAAAAAPPEIDLSDIPDAQTDGLDLSDIPDAGPVVGKADARRQKIAAKSAALKGHEPLLEAVQGFGAAAGNTVQTLASPIRKLFGMQPATPFEAPKTTAGAVGSGVEQIAEFAVPEVLAGKVTKLLAMGPKLRAAGFSKLVAEYGKATVDAALKGAGAFGVGKLQGGTNKEAAVPAVISMASPIAGAVLDTAVPALVKGAQASMGKVLGLGKSTKAGAAALDKDITKAIPAALETGLPTSWKSWMRTAQAGRRDAGQLLEAAKAGPAGDALVPKKPIIDALDDLVTNQAQHFVPPKGYVPGAPMQGAAGGVQPVTYNQPLVDAAERLKTILDEYPGQHLQARQIHDIKRMWDSVVYSAPEASQLGVNLADQLRKVDKLAKVTATNAIRDVLKVDAPTVAALDANVSMQIKLHQTIRAAAQAVKAGGITKHVATRAGTAIGASIGGYEGGWSGAAMGAVIGGSTGRMIKLAIESPMWRTIPAVTRMKIADAVVSGKADQVRRLLTPVLAGGISQWVHDSQSSTSSSGSGATSDHPTNTTATGQLLGQQ